MAERWGARAIPDLTGRTALVTGANSGLGYETARALAHRGATVLLACRDEQRGAGARDRLRTEDPAGRVELVMLDLADLDSVRRSADEVLQRDGTLDLLVNNAGVMAVPQRRTTAQGFELQMGTNHLGHFALTGLLLPALLRAAGSRVVTVTSRNHHFAKDLRVDDLQSERRYTPFDAYNRSKLANALFTLELDRRLKAGGTTVLSLAAHPGFSKTELQWTGPRTGGLSARAWLLSFGTQLLGQPAATGALPTLRAAVDPTMTGGELLGPRGPAELWGAPRFVSYSPLARDPALAAELWRRSEELTGVPIGLRRP